MRFRRRSFLSFVLLPTVLSALTVGAGFCMPIRGPWVDSALSFLLSQAVSSKATVQTSQIEAWHRIEFERLSLSTTPKAPALRTGPGRLNFGASWIFIDLTEIKPDRLFWRSMGADRLPFVGEMIEEVSFSRVTLFW